MEQGSVLVRRAHPDDAGRVAELAAELGYPAASEEMRRRIVLLEGRSDHAVLVALVAGRVEGLLHAELVHGITDDAHVEIAALVIDSALRGRGLGKELLSRAEAWARERGVARVGLRSRSTRERAHAFYLREGYHVAKTQLRFVRELDTEPPRPADRR